MAMTEYGGGLVHCQKVPGVTNILTQGTTFDYDLCGGSGGEAAVRPAPALWRRIPLAAGGASVTHVEIAHPEPHVTTWDWNGSVYLRQQDGRRHFEESGTQVSTDVIVIQRAQEQPTRYFGEGGYHIVALIGSREGTVLSGGSSVPIRWSRPGVTSPTVLVDARGDPFFLPPGRVFFEVIPPEAKVTTKG